MSKLCKRCKLEKSLDSFNKDNQKKDNLRTYCRPCDNEINKTSYQKNKDKIKERVAKYRKANGAEMKEYQKKWAQDNKEKLRLAAANYRSNNPEKVKESSNKYKRNNRGKQNAIWSKRRADKIKATPIWAELDKIAAIYNLCQQKNERSGFIMYHVDHRLPLKSDWVCGLHTIENLGIVPASENVRKGNRR